MNTFDNNTPGADPRTDRDPWAGLVKRMFEALENMDDYARMELGIEPIGAYKTLKEGIESLRAEVDRLRKAIREYRDGVRLKEARTRSEDFDWEDAEEVDYIDHEELMAGLELCRIADEIDAAMEKSK